MLGVQRGPSISQGFTGDPAADPGQVGVRVDGDPEPQLGLIRCAGQ